MPVASLLNENNSAFQGTTQATLTTITVVSPSPTYQIPAGYLKPGMTLRIKARGTYTTGVTAGSVTFTFNIGASTVASAAIAYTVSLTGAPWNAELDVQIRTIGSSGTYDAAGQCNVATALGVLGAQQAIPSTAQAVVTLDTTAANNVTLSLTSTSSQSYTCRQFSVELVNQPL